MIGLKERDIKKMNYNQLISVIGETNRPPGGIRTVINFANNVGLRKEHKVLEIGTSTGFTAIELAKMVGCKITAIDINEDSLKIATSNSESYGVRENIKFICADAMDLPFEDGEFDFVFAGNVISYIPNREKALQEYKRVLKDNGVLFVTPMFYLERPSRNLMERIRDSLKMDIQVDYEDYWDSFFNIDGLDVYLTERYKFDYITDQHIREYVEDILKTNESVLSQNITDVDSLEYFKELYTNYIYLYRDNLFKMAYKEIYARKSEFAFDRELFTSTKMKEMIINGC
mgnify:CR=1 FL=1